MSTVVAVLFGGQASEHPVSLMSTVSVLANLDKQYETYLVGITKDGRWYHFTGTLEEIEKDTWEENPDNEEVILAPNTNIHGFYQTRQHNEKRVDVILPVLHGRFGEDGMLPALCELAGIPYVAVNMTASALAMDKEYTHIVAEAAGVKMAKYICLKKYENRDLKEVYHQVEEKLGFPCYVKPCKEGSSFGCHKIHGESDFAKYIEDAFSYDNKILLEEFIDGYEVGAGVMNRGEVGEVFEIIVATEMYGFAEKYDGFKTVINTPATTLSTVDMQMVKDEAIRIYRLFDCDIMGRVDFFWSKHHGLVFNEVNTIPGFTSHSLFPASFTATGMSYSALLNHLIELALKRG